MSVDLMLYICLYVCGCVIIFDVMFAVYSSCSARSLKKHKKAILEELDRMVPIDESDIAKERAYAVTIGRWVKSEDTLIALIEALKEVKKTDKDKHRELCCRTMNVIGDSAKAYSRKGAEYKALYAYAVTCLSIGSCDSPNMEAVVGRLTELMIPNVTHRSVYVRQNTFRAIVSMGEAYPVYRAITCLNGMPSLQNGKLLCDDMLLFEGDIEELIYLLLRDIVHLDTALQVAVVDFCRFMPMSVEQSVFYGDIAALMASSDAHGEVKLACIRYFGKRRWDGAYEGLLKMLEAGAKGGFNYSAIAATALRTYPGERTIDALTAHLADSDWYTRFNCAESLLALGVDHECIAAGHTDRYAKHMLMYRRDVMELKKRDRESA